MAYSIHPATRRNDTHGEPSMTDAEMRAALERIETLVHHCTGGFKLSPSAIREVIANVSTITRLSMQLTREVIARVRTLEARQSALEMPNPSSPRVARQH